MENLIEFPGLGLSLTLNDGIMIGSFKVTYYGIVIAIGLILAMLYSFSKFKRVGVDSDRAIDCIIGGFFGGVIGARLYYVIFSWDTFKDNIWDIFNLRTGGLAIYGGIIGGILVGVIIAKIRKVKIKPLLDVVGIAFLIGQGIGRWGNFFNVEAFGGNTTMPWGMTGPKVVSYLSNKMEYFNSIGVTVDPNMPVHPCFFYEFVWCGIGVLLLNMYLKHRKFDGEVFLMYLGYYGLGRFFIEGLRTDSLMIGNLRVSQILSFAIFVACVLFIVIVRMKIKSNHDENYLKLHVLTDEGQAVLNKSSAKSSKDTVEEKVETDDFNEAEEIKTENSDEITDTKEQ